MSKSARPTVPNRGHRSTRKEVPKAETLTRLRKLALSLPGAVETITWGHPNFRVDGKIFAGFGQQANQWCVSGKVGKPRQKELLKDPRYLYADYVGRFGWVALLLEGRIDWNEVAGLLLTSYRHIAPKRLLAESERPARAKTNRSQIRRGGPAKVRRAGARKTL